MWTVENASVDEKLFIHFQETENGGFRKRISVHLQKSYTCPNPLFQKVLVAILWCMCLKWKVMSSVHFVYLKGQGKTRRQGPG